MRQPKPIPKVEWKETFFEDASSSLVVFPVACQLAVSQRWSLSDDVESRHEAGLLESPGHD